MASMLEKLTAAGVKITHGGREYTLSPLTLKDLGKLKATVRAFILDDARKVAQGLREAGAPAEVLSGLWEEAALYAKNPLVSPAMQEPEMLKEFLLLSLRTDTAITVDMIDGILGDDAVSKQLIAIANELNNQETIAGKS